MITIVRWMMKSCDVSKCLKDWLYIYIYIYIYRERERERERDTDKKVRNWTIIYF